MSSAYGPADRAEALKLALKEADLDQLSGLRPVGDRYPDMHLGRARLRPRSRAEFRATKRRLKSCGAGSFLSNDPAPSEGACATRVRRRTGDLPGLQRFGCITTRQWARDPAVIRPNVDGDSRSGNDSAPARHSTR